MKWPPAILLLLLLTVANTAQQQAAPPALPRLAASTEIKGATLLMSGAQRSARPTVTEKAIAWRYPSNIEPWRYVWSLERSVDGGKSWQMVRECDGDTTVPAVTPGEWYRLHGRKWL